MKCPKCQGEMEKITFEGIDVERCRDCKGLWFDCYQAEELREKKGSETIDTGDPEVGKKYSQISAIDCPKCHTKMVPIVDTRKPHIWYEGCPVCYGRFFDAGEFRDYKEENLLDFFRRLFPTGRTRAVEDTTGLKKEDWNNILR